MSDYDKHIGDGLRLIAVALVITAVLAVFAIERWCDTQERIAEIQSRDTTQRSTP